VTIDPEEKYARILSIPRDTRVRYNDRWRKINEVYSSAGAEGSVKAVEDLLDMAIDRYAVVDFHGVIDLVDLVGGVVVDVPTNMYKPLENIDLKKGAEQHLNGYDALAFLRYRDSRLSDMDRSERQKAVLIQLAEKILMPANVFKLPTVAKTALTYMETNISLQEILTLAKYGRTILDNGVENQVLPGINDQYNGGWYYVPFLEELGLPMGEAEKEYREYLKQAQIKKAAEASLEEVQEGAAPAQGDAENTAETSDGDGAAESGEPGAGASGEPDAQGASETGAVGASETPETGAQTEPAAQTEPMAQTGVAAQTEPTAQAGAAT
jgi:LCP family protein required for cell wall assembly